MLRVLVVNVYFHRLYTTLVHTLLVALKNVVAERSSEFVPLYVCGQLINNARPFAHTVRPSVTYVSRMLFKNPFRTSKRTPHFTITTINWFNVV
jgi:hypothetical protein